MKFKITNIKVQLQTLLYLTCLIIFTISCNSNSGIFIKTENQYETIDNKRQLVSQTIKTLRSSDSLPVAILTKVSNYNNDVRLKYLTGLKKEDGLQDYLLDSLYYDQFGNDTLKRSFVNLAKTWHLAQTLYKKYREDTQVSYFMSERDFNNDLYFKKEIFYKYNNLGNILTETEVECHQKNDCDSTIKIKYFYNSTGQLDSKIFYLWKNNEWTEHKKKNSR